MSSNDIWKEYKQERILNPGTYSFVYKAKNRKTGNYVAIKEIYKKKYKEITNTDFIEGEIMKKINSEPNESLRGTMDTPKYFNIIMDLYISNMEEYLKIRKDNLSIEEIRDILNQLNENFIKMNDKNIINKNIKPENILIDLKKINKCKIKLSDYGSCKLNNSNYHINIEDSLLTLAPEILKSGEISPKSDIWSLGVTIYYMLFKEYPYNGKEKSKIIEDIESNKQLNIINDNDLNDLLKKMLKVDLNERISWNEYFNHSFFTKHLINLPHFNFECKLHNKELNYYCCNCKLNLCFNCFKEHQNHEIIPFCDIGLNQYEINQMDNLIQLINTNQNKFNKLKENIIQLLEKIKLNKENCEIFENDNNNNYKKYYLDCLNYLNKKFEIDEKIKIIDLKGNYILCNYGIKEEEELTQILNCYEEVNKENPNIEGEGNEKEIRESCELYLNGNKIDYCFKYKFPKKGEYSIKIKLIKKLKNLSFLFGDCSSLLSIDLSNFQIINIYNTECMFGNCSSITSLNLSNFNTSNVISMAGMFGNCCSLVSLNLSSFNTSNVKNMAGMFGNCSCLVSLDLSNFKTNNVTDMSGMFASCSSLESLNLSNFNTDKVINMEFMFLDCSSLSSLNLSNFNTNNVINIEGMFSGLSNNCNIFSKDQNILNIK